VAPFAAGTAAAQLQEAFSSHPQQVCQSLEAALRLVLQAHPLQSAGHGGVSEYRSRVQTLVEAAHSCTRRDLSSGSSGSSSSAQPVVEGAAAKQLFSLLVTCLKAAGQMIDDASSSSSSNVERCDAGDNSTNRAYALAAQLAPAELCSRVCVVFQHVGGQQLQLLLRSRCLSQLAR
jgi:hypothetical protein